VAALPGDGIGTEVMDEAIKTLEVVKERYSLEFEILNIPCGGMYFKKTGREWPEGSFEMCKESDAILLGALGMPGVVMTDGKTPSSKVIFGLRFGFDLYANVRPVRLYPNVKHEISGEFRRVWKDVDFVIVRENTEGAYAPIRGHLERGGQRKISIDNRLITRVGSERIVRFAFELASTRHGSLLDGKKRVTCVDKSNVLAGCKLFREMYDEVAALYQGIERDYAYVDAFTQWLLKKPRFYDVVVTTNLFGDILSDLAAVLQGGMGMAPSGNIGEMHAMFEPVHGSAPDIAGKNIANPMAMILSTKMMMEWLGKKKGDDTLLKCAENLESAVVNVLKDGRVLTPDMGGNSKCSELGAEVRKRLADKPV
jgi:3-isopropylmalate dehydrogenase